MEDVLKRMLEAEEQGEAIIQEAEARAKEIRDSVSSRIAGERAAFEQKASAEWKAIVQQKVAEAEAKASALRSGAAQNNQAKRDAFTSQIQSVKKEIFRQLVFPEA